MGFFLKGLFFGELDKFAEEKKMSLAQFSPIFNRAYVPAELQHHPHGNGWLIVFYALHPVTGEMTVRRIRLNRLRKKCKSLAEFKSEAGRMVLNINIKLAGGWSPFGMQSPAVRQMEDLAAVTHRYLNDRRSEIRNETYVSYSGVLKLFRDWLSKNLPGCRCLDFNELHAVMYMEARWDSGIKARTYNNNLKALNAFFAWCIEKRYAVKNPFSGIRERKEEKKARTIIPLAQLSAIRQYFEKRCPEYVLVMLFVYFSGMRPREITRIKVKQLRLHDKCVLLSEATTKTHAERKAPLSKEQVLLLARHIDGASSEDYVIGKNYTPDADPATVKSFQRRWRNMRDSLRLPEAFQLYSLRDCCAHYRLESREVAPIDAMHGMGHKHLDQTLEYGDHGEATDLANRLERGTPSF